MRKYKIIISGGGTGGHIFPAVSIANRFKEEYPDADILFVGAQGRMEMDRVPAAGYKIIGLPIMGLQRKLSLSVFKVAYKLIKSLFLARKVLKEFKPDIAIGVGGYASAPLLYMANKLNIPTLIQEQNGYAGLTNKILGRRAKKICVAYDGMERFFPKENIVLTGNPTRANIQATNEQVREEALKHYGFDATKKHIFIVGGSLGSKTLNTAVQKWIGEGCPNGENIEIIWQCGKFYKTGCYDFMKQSGLKNIKCFDFIDRMDLAYALSDIIVTRSGAGTISELCIVKKACIFVPSPNVTENHQWHNAMALVRKDAGILIEDKDAEVELMKTACSLAFEQERIEKMENNISQLAMCNAAQMIVKEITKIIK